MTTKEPLIYCKDCQSSDCWERFPAHDWLTENHEILEYAYRCTKCGHTTIRPYEVMTLHTEDIQKKA
jgi:DNA-directed RNA polymerase subunit RPC12/RpoP